jgi:hypothetical protein
VRRVTQFATRRRAILTLAAVVLVAVVAAVAFQTLGRADSSPAPPLPAVLPASAVAYLPSHVSRLTTAELQKDANVSSMPATLGKLGYVAGAQRTFQGPSKRRLQVVVSRTLRFRTAAGAAGYLRFVHDHAGAYVGDVPTLKPLASGSRSGWLIVAPLCACHMAQPDLLAVVSGGRNVTWLMVNGPGAKPAVLRALLAQAP